MNIETKEYILYFSRLQENWWHKYIGGYNHIDLVLLKSEWFDLESAHKICLSPGISNADLSVLDFELFKNHCPGGENRLLHIKVRSIPKPRLIGIKPQTCATFIQYVVGIDLGTILCQKMYDILTSSKTSYLFKKGILEVKEWDPSITL